MADNRNVDHILDVLGDQYARAVLSVLHTESLSVKEISKVLGISLTTVYRRIEWLEKYDLISSRTRYSNDGNHYLIYSCDFSTVLISLESGEHQVKFLKNKTLPRRFSELWEDLKGDETE